MALRFNLICVSVQKDEPEVHLSRRVGIVQERSRTRHGNWGVQMGWEISAWEDMPGETIHVVWAG